MAERIVEANDAELCTESFGDPAGVPVLLIAGIGASMLWWEEAFCQALADRGRFVIRYDHRDTGRSVTYPVGSPGYTGGDLVADAVAVLDAYQLPSANLVGVSAGGAFAQAVALGYPDRVATLTLISTSPAAGGDRKLPAPSGAFIEFMSTAAVDWSRPDSVIDHLVAYARVLGGEQRRFDEARIRNLLIREVARARDFAARQNHDLLSAGETLDGTLESIAVPTLVIHGTADPMFPIEHGKALAQEIPHARLLPLPGARHGIDPADWDMILSAILEHTGLGGGRDSASPAAPHPL